LLVDSGGNFVQSMKVFRRSVNRFFNQHIRFRETEHRLKHEISYSRNFFWAFPQCDLADEILKQNFGIVHGLSIFAILKE
jgi:hypothetical protein